MENLVPSASDLEHLYSVLLGLDMGLVSAGCIVKLQNFLTKGLMK